MKTYAIVYPEVAKFCQEVNKEKELVECISKLDESIKDLDIDSSEVTTFIDVVDEVVFTINLKVSNDTFKCNIYNVSL